MNVQEKSLTLSFAGEVGDYDQLPDYLKRLVVANPGTITSLFTETIDGGAERFKYMFVAFGASIQGYEYMRKVIVVDGTHLKDKYAGCLLTASAQDGNYQIFPLAFAIVDSENDSSWEWFFQQMTTFVNGDEGLVFVSDRHTSISKGISKVIFILATNIIRSMLNYRHD